MIEDEVTITLPISSHALGTLLTIFLVLGLSLLVYAVLRPHEPKNWLGIARRKMGLTGIHPVIVLVLSSIWVVLFLTLLTGIFWVLYGIGERAAAVTEEEGRELRWYLLTLTAITASLGAVISLPFTLIRVTLNRRQTETAEQGHITDRINKAVEGLGAEKSAKNQLANDDGTLATDAEGKYVTVERTVPNLEVRIGAIYALERIAQDSDRDHVQIMEILCAYIRQNAPAPQSDDWPQLEMKESEDYGPLEADWKGRLETFREAQKSAKVGLKVREDIQVALTVLGRRWPEQRLLEARAGEAKEDAAFVLDLPCPEYDGPEDGHEPAALDAQVKALEDWKETFRGYKGYRLDLRNANLRGADLSGLNLNGAKLTGSFLQGADLDKARLQGADLDKARLQGAVLNKARLQGAFLFQARLEGVELWGARLRGTDLGAARLQGAHLWGARLQGAHLAETRLQDANLGDARLQGANVTVARLQAADLYGAQLQGADLYGARLQRADLKEARLDSQTDLSGATLRSAAVRSVDFSDVPQIAEHLQGIFGDGSVKLPNSGARPVHWPEYALDGVVETEDGEIVDRFDYEWRKWQADPGAYEPPEDADAG